MLIKRKRLLLLSFTIAVTFSSVEAAAIVEKASLKTGPIAASRLNEHEGEAITYRKRPSCFKQMGFALALLATKGLGASGRFVPAYRNKITRAANGDLVTAGYTDAFGAGGEDMLLARFSPDGILQWSKAVGTSGDDHGEAVIETADGGLFAAGATGSYGTSDRELLVSKFDADGLFDWATSFGNEIDYTNYAWATTETQDGDIVVVGEVGQGVERCRLFISRLSANGTLIWWKGLGPLGQGLSYGRAVTEASNGDLLVVGSTTSYGAGNFDIFCNRFSADGVLRWSKTLGSPGLDHGEGVIETNDEHLLIMGYVANGLANNQNILLSKFSAGGEFLWARTFGGLKNDTGYSFLQDSAGDIVIGGQSDSYGSASTNFFLVKVDADGVLQWAKTLGGEEEDGAYSVTQSSDGIVISGYSKSYAAVGANIVLSKFDTHGTFVWARVLGVTYLDADHTISCGTPLLPKVTDVTDLVSSVSWLPNITSPAIAASDLALQATPLLLKEYEECTSGLSTESEAGH